MTPYCCKPGGFRIDVGGTLGERRLQSERKTLPSIDEMLVGAFLLLLSACGGSTSGQKSTSSGRRVTSNQADPQ